ncbi:MAG: hypothetical protein E2O74_03735 [Chloroflexi bacterium]|nr:hypothetical protein [Chloroflexota bacterium]TDI85263.1 MAG: hypothetical protein E2O74_03735 [Chloroflexota bacterium]
MIEELSMVSRARMHLILSQSGGAQPHRKPSRKSQQLIARAIRWLGRAIVSLGRRLERNAENLVGETELLRPTEA